ncbi:methyltransferase domain-containing protein [Tropicimonas sediminicola]|nr:methyltransferase domain-containing protein [Tropicimonas sediminicola]
MKPPRLTDRTALDRARIRASKAPGGMADFLHRTLADEVQERLEVVNRSFTDAVVISGFPELWARLMPQARQVADTEVLDLEAGSCDLILHALALHWADDPVGQLAQARYALRPDGLFLGCLFGGETLSELRAALAEAEAAEMGGLSPRIAPMGEIRDVGALMQRAGFALPVADSIPLTVTYESALHLMRDLRAMGETNALADRHRAPVPRRLFLRAAETYAARFPADDGRVSATFELIFLTGWAPDASQPQPLRPGSASARLADALGTSEQKLGDRASPESDDPD